MTGSALPSRDVGRCLKFTLAQEAMDFGIVDGILEKRPIHDT